MLGKHHTRQVTSARLNHFGLIRLW